MTETARKPRRIARGWLIALGTAVILLITGVATVVILNQNRTAQATAQAYFEALAAGDAEVARALTAPAAFEQESVRLLTNEALAGATELISDVLVVPANDPLDTFDQKVTVSYTLAGERFVTPFLVSRGEPEWGFLKTYEITHPFAKRVSFSLYPVGTLTIADTEVSIDAPTVTLYPAVYPVASTEPELLEMEPAEVVATGDTASVDITFRGTAKLEDQLQLRVNEFLDECAGQMEMGEDNSICPLFVYIPHADTTSGTWEIVEYPIVELHPEMLYFSTEGGTALFTPENGDDPVEMFSKIVVPGLTQVEDGQVKLVTEW